MLQGKHCELCKCWVPDTDTLWQKHVRSSRHRKLHTSDHYRSERSRYFRCLRTKMLHRIDAYVDGYA